MINSLISKTKRNILALIFLNPDRQFYLLEIARLISISQGTIHREIKALVEDGILNAEKKNSRIFYSVNKNNPIYEELKSIVYKTFGVADELRDVLKRYKKRIDIAFIYGSVAKGADTGKSDIDVFIVSGIKFSDLAAALSSPEQKLGRPVNVHSLTPAEFKTKVEEGNYFVSGVLKTEKILLIGTNDDIERMAKKPMVEKRTNQRQRNSRPVRSG